MTTLILLAAGLSKRIKGFDKTLFEINDKPLILYSLGAFKNIADAIVIAANKNNFRKIKKLAPKSSRTEPKIILGGKTRQKSVERAIKFLAKSQSAKFRLAPDDLIIIHNAANPFATTAEIKKCLSLAKKHGAAITGRRPIDTVKATTGNFIAQTLPREKILLAQTPQIFKWEILQSSYKNTKKQIFTDDASMVEAAGYKIAWTQASYANKKITFAEDAATKTLIGIGSDYHKFSTRRSPHTPSASGGHRRYKQAVAKQHHQANTGAMNKLSRSDTASGTLVLGGAKFPKYFKLKADSDGDAVLHALSAAISSALGGGSLGTFATPMCKRGIKDSKKYLGYALARMVRTGYEISNISINIETSAIKIDPIANKIRDSISRLTKAKKTNISITAIRGKSKKDLYCSTAITLTDRSPQANTGL
ncbi:2-C-methyl-D-erythritol 2,4-cyclodiphosphate synthase [Candidatus Peregrinibacteria bacterium]|nr:2-C-methyl-D-erythritol 2,4-cyclodiphosphate synthase [Candidatus Peregrinibacteria bacterium]